MTDDEDDQTISSAEDVKEWAENNFNGMKNRFQSLQDELRNNKPRENINVRRVDSENLKNQEKDQIIVEYSVERWYSIDYFKNMINSSNNSSEQGEGGDIFP